MSLLSARKAVLVFLAFALAYFLSTLVRAVTATLSPVLTAEFALQARDLGLLAGGYFLGFTLTQLPLGHWLDRLGPRRVLLAFLAVAVLGCVAFAAARSFPMLVLARMLCGIGLSACLMAPLTGYRRWMTPALQLRASSWMLMTGSLGAVASTLPVQWLLPAFGWRPLFWGLAALLLLAMAVIRWQVPSTPAPAAPISLPAPPEPAAATQPARGYGHILRSPYFRRMAPLGFFSYGGLIAVLTLWASPWMTVVAGDTPLQAATGLFWINIAVLLAYSLWGLSGPMLARRGWHADRLVAYGLPLSFAVLLALVLLPADLRHWSGALLAAFCVASTFVTPSQPAVGMAFGPELAGRALSAYNLVVFLGVFALQWGMGLGVDLLVAWGWDKTDALRGVFAALLAACVCAYMYFLRGAGHNGRP